MKENCPNKDNLYIGDCLYALTGFKENTIDLIYLDPPFFSQKQQKLRTRDNTKEYLFNDIWKNIDSYISYIKERVEKCYYVLKETGCIFLHCDRSASHHLRILLDKIFGEDNFQSEIIWSYKRWSNAKKGLLNSHQVIYFYSKTVNFKFNHIYDDYSLTTNLDQIFQKRHRDERGKSAYKKDSNGDREIIEKKKGVPLTDVWDIPYLNPKAEERVGYPTQKPVLLLERIIELVTDEGDVVLDPFCGSGTTLVAAKLLNREYIGIDISEEAINITKQRIRNPIKTNSRLLIDGKEAYKNQSNDILELLNSINAVPVQRNSGIDGFLRNSDAIKPIPIRIQRKEETIEETRLKLNNACKINKYEKKVIFKTNKKSADLLFECNDLMDGIIVFDTIEDLQNNINTL